MANLRANNVCGTDGRNAITGSVEIDGTGDYLSLSSSGDFGFGTGDFTIEFFFYSNNVRGTGAVPGQQLGFFQTSDTTGGLKPSYASGIVIFQGSTKSSGGLDGGLVANIIGTNVGSSSAVITTGSWNHCALTRSSGTVRLFLNGILIDSGSITGSIDGTNLAVGGYYDTSYLFNGFLSNFRIIKGTALYTSNFIPPTKKLIRLPGTVLLCCQDNNSVTVEATGKTITANGNPAARRFVPQVGSDGGLVFDGVTKVNTQNYFYLPTGVTENREPAFPGVSASSARAVFAGGIAYPATTRYNTIDYVTISSTGDAIDFGDLFGLTQYCGACASPIRGIFGGGYVAPAQQNTIQYITIASTGNALDFGDLTNARNQLAGLSNSTRGLFFGGNPQQNTIEYIAIATSGIAQDFGDLLAGTQNPSGCASSTRGIIGSGETTPTVINTIQYVTISSTGNAISFGNLTQARRLSSSSSNSTRGLFGGGATPTDVNTIDYITIASTGNATDFGDLLSLTEALGSCSSSTRGLFAGGYVAPTAIATNTIQYVTILTTGNAVDFGDLTVARRQVAACSNGHGGLG